MPEEQLAPLEFPVNGLDLTQGFGAQRPGTTPVGTNVRTFETLTQRGRGGSRQGLTRYVLPQLPTAAKIQCLDYVVDPSADALLVDDGFDPTPGIILDPSTNPPGSNPSDPNDQRVRNRGNEFPVGGTGAQPNRNVKFKHKTYSGSISANPTSVMADGMATSTITVTILDQNSHAVVGDTIVLHTSPAGRVGDGSSGTTNSFGQVEFEVTDTQNETVVYTASDTTRTVSIGSASVNFGGWQFVQGRAQIFQSGSPVGSTTYTFMSDVTAGHLLVLFARDEIGFASIWSITDSQGNVWTNIHPGFNATVGFFTTANTSGPCTITINFGVNSTVVSMAIVEYRGNAITPLDSFTFGGGSGTGTTWPSSTLNLSSGNGLSLCGFFGVTGSSGFGTFTASAPYTLRVGAVFNDTPTSTLNNFCVQVADNLNVTTVTDVVTISTTISDNYFPYGVTFK